MDDKKIRLNPEFTLMYDGRNCWLVKPRISSTGKEYLSDAYCGYHTSFESLLIAFAKMRLPEKDAKTVKSILQNLSEVQKEVEDLARQIGQGLDKKGGKGRGRP